VNGTLTIKYVTQRRVFEVLHDLNHREIAILLAGGLLNYTRNHS
jgi:hypothetical protein